LKTLIYGYNCCPENFGVPSDEVINEVIAAVEHQMLVDKKEEEEDRKWLEEEEEDEDDVNAHINAH
jgi:hypothetical protein